VKFFSFLYYSNQRCLWSVAHIVFHFYFASGKAFSRFHFLARKDLVIMCTRFCSIHFIWFKKWSTSSKFQSLTLGSNKDLFFNKYWRFYFLISTIVCVNHVILLILPLCVIDDDLSYVVIICTDSLMKKTSTNLIS